ncbi:hypothetical protein H4R35_007256 [Dimargaris xerosporica]|nr:hypothetical protein H4R35_007256 [Dimargaris xerosporica]
MGLTDDEDAISIASGDGEPRLPVTENAAVAVARDRIMPLLLNQNVRYAVEEFDRCYTFILLVNAPATFQPAHHRYLLRLMDKVQTATYPANLPYITSYLLRLVIDAGNKRNYPAQQFLMIASAMIQNAYPELESMMNNIPMYEQAANADWIAVSSPRTA